MYQVYSITSPDNKYRYYGTTSNVATRIYKHQYRFSGGDGSNYYVYKKLRESVSSIYECNIKVIKEFNNKVEARRLEQLLIEKYGNLNSISAIA